MWQRQFRLYYESDNNTEKEINVCVGGIPDWI